MSLVSVVVDSREPAHIKDLRFGGAPVLVSMLDAGDLMAATDDGALLLVERKTVSDFLGTLKDDRLFPQIARLRAVTPWAYLFICGQWQPGSGGKTFANGIETGWQWSSIQGALLTCQELGVHVCQVSGDHDYEAAILRLANRSRAVVRVAPARDTTIVTEEEQVLAALPGIGADKASTLIKHCGAPYMALSYLTYWRHLDRENIFADIPGINEGTQRRVRRALDLPEHLYLTVQEMSNGKE